MGLHDRPAPHTSPCRARPITLPAPPPVLEGNKTSRVPILCIFRREGGAEGGGAIISVASVRERPMVLRPRASFSRAVERWWEKTEGVEGRRGREGAGSAGVEPWREEGLLPARDGGLVVVVG